MRIKDIVIIILLAILIASNIIHFSETKVNNVTEPIVVSDTTFVTKIDTVKIYLTKIKTVTVVDSAAIKAVAFLDRIVILQLDYIEALQEDLKREKKDTKLYKPSALESQIFLE